MRILVDYEGASIRLTDERLAHILEHPEMKSMQEEIERTVRAPEVVVRSASDAGAALHYRFYVGTRVGDKWLCVVVKYREEDAFVLTAYLTDRPKKGEQLWPRIAKE